MPPVEKPDLALDVVRLQERYAALAKDVKDIKGIMTYVGGLLITLILTVLGWSLVQQLNTNEAQKKVLQDQIVRLQDATQGSSVHSEHSPAAANGKQP